MAGVGRGKNYTDGELNQLCYSFLHVSQDPAIGNGQRAEKFWHRVQEHYNQNKPSRGEVRGRKSLEGKFADIKHDVSKFIGCFQQVESRQTSGANDEDNLNAARELYRENHPKQKSFSFEGPWSILRDYPRWRCPQDDMARLGKVTKVKSTSAAAPITQSDGGSPEVISTSDGDTDQAIDSNKVPASNGLRRPMGNKRAKEEIKRARIQEDSLRISAEAQREQAVATKDLARANFLRARTMENNSTIALLSMPIDAFSPELKSFMSDWKIEEARKLKARMEQASRESFLPSFDAEPPRAPPNPLPTVRQPLFPMPPRPEGMPGREGILVEETTVADGLRVSQSVADEGDDQIVDGPGNTLAEAEADAEFHALLKEPGQF